MLCRCARRPAGRESGAIAHRRVPDLLLASRKLRGVSRALVMSGDGKQTNPRSASSRAASAPWRSLVHAWVLPYGRAAQTGAWSLKEERCGML